MKRLKLPKLPKTIKVHVFKGESGRLLAKLTEYEVFTEAGSEQELDNMINDLIYDLFEVPKEYQYKLKYVKEQDKEFEKIKKMIVMSTPDILRSTFRHGH